MLQPAMEMVLAGDCGPVAPTGRVVLICRLDLMLLVLSQAPPTHAKADHLRTGSRAELVEPQSSLLL